jgi:hypothetical protein
MTELLCHRDDLQADGGTHVSKRIKLEIAD